MRMETLRVKGRERGREGKRQYSVGIHVHVYQRDGMCERGRKRDRGREEYVVEGNVT